MELCFIEDTTRNIGRGFCSLQKPFSNVLSSINRTMIKNLQSTEKLEGKITHSLNLETIPIKIWCISLQSFSATSRQPTQSVSGHTLNISNKC